MEKTNQLVNIRQASKILGVHPDTLRRWEKQGRIKSIRIGKRKDRRYSLDEISSFLRYGDLHAEIKTNSIFVETPKLIIDKAKLILFDASDTLMSPFPSRGVIYTNIALEQGFKIDPNKAEIEHYRLYSDWEKEKLFSDESIQASTQVRKTLYSKLNADVFKNCGIETSFSELLSMGEKVFNTIMYNSRSWKIIDEVVTFLEKCTKEGKNLGVVDNWDKGLHSILKDLGIAKYFKYIISGGELGLRKPTKDIFIHALNLFQISAKDSVYIGNRYIDDVIGPKNAGITPLLYDPLCEKLYSEVPTFAKFSELI